MMRYVLSFIVSFSAVFSLAQAVELPHRKSGLWEIKMHSPEMPQPMVSERCVDEKTDRLLAEQARGFGKAKCSKESVRREGNRILAEIQCKMGNTTTTNTTVFTGDFASHYRAEITNTYSPPLDGRKSDRMTLEARWLGPCKPGQKPGDVSMSGKSFSFNLTEMQKHAQEWEKVRQEAYKRLPPEYRARMPHQP